jgi:hypothetical protein
LTKADSRQRSEKREFISGHLSTGSFAGVHFALPPVVCRVSV